MQLTTSQLKDFKNIYENYFWVELSEQETLEYATSLITLMKAIVLSSNQGKRWK